MLMRTAGRIFDLDDLSTAPGISTWLNSWCRDVGPSFLFLGAIDAKSSVPIGHQSLVDLPISGESRAHNVE
jgi:hypothetical protein